MIAFLTELLFHLDEFLISFIGQYGGYIYPLIFVIIFCETGLFVPFLPGDSLIFACAAFSAAGLLNGWAIVLICYSSALLGDTLNFYIGRSAGKRLYEKARGRLFKKENVDKAKAFYDRYGGKAIIISRFVPLIRQFTPFVTGIGDMSFGKFMSMNVIGVTLWVGILSLLGYFFGNIEAVKNNFTAVLLMIIFVSLLPAVIAFLRSRYVKRTDAR